VSGEFAHSGYSDGPRKRRRTKKKAVFWKTASRIAIQYEQFEIISATKTEQFVFSRK
jgi:hypothetical protein